MNTALFIEGMFGLGDSIYQVPIVHELCRRHPHVYLRTPWPQLYSAQGLHFVKPVTSLRTQARNATQQSKRYVTTTPRNYTLARLSYVAGQRQGVPLFRGLVQSVRHLLPLTFHYNIQSRPACLSRGNYVVIRPPTLRREWLAPSRNPLMAYIQEAIDHLNAAGVPTIVVADIHAPEEIYDGPRPLNATEYMENGQLDLPSLLQLVYGARFVVGGVGFLAPMAMSLQTPALIVHGGAGGWNAPAHIDAPGGHLTHLLPDQYCLCKQHHHTCNKQITPLRLQRALDLLLKQTSPVPAGLGKMASDSCPLTAMQSPTTPIISTNM